MQVDTNVPGAPRLDAVIFEVNGTLVDSNGHGHRLAYNEAFAAMGMSDRWSDEQYGELLSIVGGRRRIATYLVNRGLGPGEAVCLGDELHRIKTTRFQDMAASGAIPLVPGARRLVNSLRRDGVRLLVATNGSSQWVNPLLDHHFGPSTFEHVVTAADVRKLKPEPDLFLRLLRRAKLKANHVVAIESSAIGLRAAHRAGIRCLVVRNGHTGRDVSEADVVVTGLGPNGRIESGAQVPLPDGLVTIDTISALVGRKVVGAHAKRRNRWFPVRRL